MSRTLVFQNVAGVKILFSTSDDFLGPCHLLELLKLLLEIRVGGEICVHQVGFHLMLPEKFTLFGFITSHKMV